MEQIITLISNVGFPIVMTLLMFKFTSETLESVKQAIADNTIAIEKLIENMRKDKGEE